jgi:membrane protein DedA with SNARE-associated domain
MELITDLLSSASYFGIFLVLMSGVFGPPIPDEIFLIIIGYWSFGGSLDFFPSLALIITGSLAGTFLNYLVGRFCLYSTKLIKIPNSPRLASKMLTAQDLVKRFGPGLVGGSYFLPGLRHWVPVMAGLLKARPGPFGLGAGLGAVLWSTVYLTLGYFLAKNGVTLPSSLDHSLYLAIPGSAIILLAVWLARRKLWGEKSAEVSTRI